MNTFTIKYDHSSHIYLIVGEIHDIFYDHIPQRMHLLAFTPLRDFWIKKANNKNIHIMSKQYLDECQKDNRMFPKNINDQVYLKDMWDKAQIVYLKYLYNSGIISQEELILYSI